MVKTDVHVRQPTNTSPHNPIVGELLLDGEPVSSKKTSSRTVAAKCKPQISWDKLDHERYIELTEVVVSLI